MTTTELARATVDQAADAFMAELEKWAANYHSDLSTDIRGPLAELVAMLSSVAAADRIAAFERECLVLIDEHEKWLSVEGTNAYVSIPAVRLVPAWAALDEALTPFDDQLLEAARREVAAAEADLGRLQRRLAAAVERSEIETVRELRELVEFSAPNRVGDARARLRDLEVDRARAVLERAAPRGDAARAEAERAAAVHAEAERALAVATEQLTGARARQSLPAQVESAIWGRLQEAARLRDQEAGRAGEDKQARLRQLTGLQKAAAVPSREPTAEADFGMAARVLAEQRRAAAGLA